MSPWIVRAARKRIDLLKKIRVWISLIFFVIGFRARRIRLVIVLFRISGKRMSTGILMRMFY